MRTFFLLAFCMFSVETVQAQQTCKPESISASTPDSQLMDNGDGTITDSNTGLMWKKCLEGLFGKKCENGSANLFTWQQALHRIREINSTGGFATHTDWRFPNVKELSSLVEEQCYNPSINMNRFPNMSSSVVWSGSPYAYDSLQAWYVHFDYGQSYISDRYSSYAVRLVRGGN